MAAFASTTVGSYTISGGGGTYRSRSNSIQGPELERFFTHSCSQGSQKTKQSHQKATYIAFRFLVNYISFVVTQLLPPKIKH